MTNMMTTLFHDIHLSKANLTLYHDGNYFSIASTVSAYSILQMLLRVVADGSTRSLSNAIYDCRSLGIDAAFV